MLQIVVKESRKIDEARGGVASVHPSAPKFSDLFTPNPIFMWPEINGEKTQVHVWESTVQYSTVLVNSIFTTKMHKGQRSNCSPVKYCPCLENQNKALLLLVSNCRYSGNLL